MKKQYKKTESAPKKASNLIPPSNETIRKKENKISFFKFMIQKSQLLDLSIILVCCLFAYLFLRYCYPYPGTAADSGGYIDAAMQDIFYIYRPFGYSYFLQLLHAVTTNVHSIFIIQISLLFFATYFLAVTVKYFYAPAKKWLWYASLSFLIFTPTSFVMANWIMSDLLFSVLVYFMVVMFIFIIKRESWAAAVLYLLFLFPALHVRYSAIVFPFALIPFFLMKKGKIRWVITILSIAVFSLFYFQTKNAMKERGFPEQFSTGFDGWNYSNNVLYALPYIDIEANDFKDPELQYLHNFIMEDIDLIKKITDNSNSVSTNHFMWNRKLTLRQYQQKIMREQDKTFLAAFVELGSNMYKDYAWHIIMNYPFSFFRYYYLPNIKQAFYPPAILIAETGNEKQKIIYEYYDIDKENKMQAKLDFLSNPEYETIMQILHLIMWIAIAAIGVTAFLRRKKLAFSTDDKIVFGGLFCFAAIYYAANIFAAPMEIRYFIPMHAIQFIFCYLLLNKLSGNEESEIIEKTNAGKKNKYTKFVYTGIAVTTVLFISIYLMKPQKVDNLSRKKELVNALQKKDEQRMNEFIEACQFVKTLPDSIKIITRKPEIFQKYAGNNKQAIDFPHNANEDSIIAYLRKTNATHLILDDRFRYAYLTLYPAVQKNPEKFKVLKEFGKIDTVIKSNPTYVLEFNDEWGYHGERVDGKKTGEGYEIFQDGRKYVGHFENNQFNGEGTLFNKDGNVIYKGFWRNNTIIKGEGELNFRDGMKYIGSFDDQMPNGYGTLYDKNGNIITKGKWRNGTFVGAN